MNPYKLDVTELELLKMNVEILQKIWEANYEELNKLRKHEGIRSSQILAFMAFKVIEQQRKLQ